MSFEKIIENDSSVIRLNEVDNITIFTEKFLEHNKQRETELRNLKKMTTDCEEQNAMLQKHIENMNLAIEQLEKDVNHKKNSNTLLYQHLTQLRTQLFSTFCDTPIPGTNEYPTLDTIDTYIHKLQLKYKQSQFNSKDLENIQQKIFNVLNKIDS